MADDTKALDAAIEQIALLSADVRLYRQAMDNLSAKVDALRELTKARDEEIERLREHHRHFVVSLVRSKCVGAPETAVLDDLVYDEYETDVVVALQRYTPYHGPYRRESLMYKSTRVYPQRAALETA